MKRNLTIWLALALAIFALPAYQSALLAAPQSQSATATPIAEEEPAATPEPAEEPAEAADDHDHNDEVNSAAEAPTLEELAARVSALEAQLADRGASDANTVATALYLLDNVGLHDLDTRLNEAGTIEAGDAGTVARINRVLSTILWPSDLAADATTLMDTLTQLNAALSDDDLTTAAPLANQAHEAQHTLSHATEHWLAHQGESIHHMATVGQANRVATTVYLLDSVGLHELDDRLNNEAMIDPSDAGTIARIQQLLTSVDWPVDLATDAGALNAILTELNSALANDDVASAAPLATEAHEAGHELSHAAEHWLATALGGADQGAEEMTADDDHDHGATATENGEEGDNDHATGEEHSHD